MTISEAMDATSDEYNEEVERSKKNSSFAQLMVKTIDREYREIDKKLPEYVADIARASGVPVGTYLPPYVYQMARVFPHGHAHPAQAGSS